MKSEIQQKDICFKSSNGNSIVSGAIYTHREIPPKAIVQISHGMCEHIGRYHDFIEYLVKNGFAVAGHDHLGHGKTAQNGEYGYFSQKNGAKYVLNDLYQMNQLTHKCFPNLPYFLLGHSMGSFFARLYAAVYPNTIDGLILSGTAGPTPGVDAGILLTEFLMKTKGEKFVSPVVQKIAFGKYLSQIKNPKTQYDWISRDERIVSEYAKDEACTFVFTVSAFHELFSTLRAVSSEKWVNRIPKDLPIFLFSGDADPVGNYGKGVIEVENMLKKANIKDVELLLYSKGRHEMLNELNRTKVYADVLDWLNRHIDSKVESEGMELC